ncbi:hypothetical protein B296_00005484 [Ensete ventricosum]|uniref:5'-nucleotidase n=1 Tax=Ensete ventricosum TaxID=4639 RepID=A0A427A4C1_ENSVE|nr:hypothetical protein B296_00005484 [Ensete ventricosum]
MVDLIEFCGSCSLRRLQNPVLTPVRFKNPARTPARALGLPCPGARKARAPRRCAINAESVEGEVFSVTSSSKSDVDYLGESTKGDLNVNPEHLDAFCEFSTQLLPSVLGGLVYQRPLCCFRRAKCRFLLRILGLLLDRDPFSLRNSPRGIFCSRTLNLRSISAIGYDMDYTLIHYNVMVSD